MVPDLLGGADLLDLTLVHQDHPIRDLQGLFLIMGDKDAGHVQFVVQSAQPAAQLFAHLGVQRAKGLIQQQHLGFDRQGPRQGDALPLTARQLRRVAIGQPVQLHQAQQVMHPTPNLRFGGACRPRAHAQAKSDVLKHRHVAKQRVVLEHKADLALAHMHVGRVFAAESDAACVGGFEASNDAQQRGLAATRRTQEGQQLARADVQADVVERGERTELFVDVPNFDAHGGAPTRSVRAGKIIRAWGSPGARRWPRAGRARAATPPPT